MIPPPPWVYQPQLWDIEELREEYNGNPVPTPADIPRDIKIVIQEGEGPGSRQIKLVADKSQLILEVGPPHQPFLYSDIRYVTTNCRVFARESDRYVILVSLRTDHPSVVRNLFIKEETAASTLATLNFLQYHIFEYLKNTLGQEDPSVVQQYMRPLIASKFAVEVHNRTIGQTSSGDRILVLDQEGVALYMPRLYPPVPSEPPMFFWREQDDRSVSKVSRIKSANCILFQSPGLYIVLPNNQEMAPELEREIGNVGKNMPMRAFSEPRVLLQCLSDSYVEEPEEEIREVDFEPVKLDEEQLTKLERLEEELRTGLRGFGSSESATLWANQEAELKNLLRGGRDLLPSADQRPKDFDPNSVDDLIVMMERIEELLFVKVNFPQALSTAVSLQRHFLESHVLAIRGLIEKEDPLSLLKKIYARGNRNMRGAPPGSYQQNEDEDVDMTGGDADD